MISPRVDALMLALILTFILGLAVPGKSGGSRKRRFPRPVLSVGLILTMAIMAAVGEGSYPPLARHGTTALAPLVLGALILYTAGVWSDLRRPSSRRHFIATLAGGVCLHLAGLRVSILGLPFLGQVTLNPVAELLFTLIWVFLVVSMVELCALIPLVAGGVTLLLGLGTLLPLPVFETFVGFVLGGSIIGGIIGRSTANLVLTRSFPLGKSEIFVLGYLVAAATLATYLKSLTLASFILPLGFIVIVGVLLFTRSFDRSLILRKSPRD